MAQVSHSHFFYIQADIISELNLIHPLIIIKIIINQFYSFIQAIYNEILEYEDGTPATASQVAKDITTFLMWTANHEFDERKQMTIKVN